MLKKISIYIWLGLLTVGVIFPNFYSSLFETMTLGTTSYPASLDSLTNPSGTDSVATVSHYAQHANANDAIEALQAKTGISASTPIANSILVGNGTGSSIWSLFATSTQFSATNFNATGSSTLQNFSFLGALGSRSTTTSATTTNFFSSVASTTSLFGTNVGGFGLAPCIGTSFLQFSNNQFSCAAVSVNSASSNSATSTAGTYLAKSFDLTAGQKLTFTGGSWDTSAISGCVLKYRFGTYAASTTVMNNVSGATFCSYTYQVYASTTMTIWVDYESSSWSGASITGIITN